VTPDDALALIPFHDFTFTVMLASVLGLGFGACEGVD
jgi:hypothetical protein